MCGIVGYVGPKQATPLLVAGLRKLEYRGYDSAGLAVTDGGRMQVVRCRGKLSGLEDDGGARAAAGHASASATRAGRRTGARREINAHPHKAGPVAVVHNGIIENHLALRARLEAAGRKFSSETDTEIVAHLIDEALLAGAPTLVDGGAHGAARRCDGAYALAVVSDKHPGQIVAAKNASPLVLGLGEGETFLASDVPAILEHTREVIFLDEGDIAEITSAGVKLTEPRRHAGRARRRGPSPGARPQAEKGGYKHFMLKEIHEQPRAIADTLRGAPAARDARRRPRRLRDRRARRCGGSCCSRAAPRTTRRWSASS